MQIKTHGGDIYGGNYRLDFSTNLNPLGMPASVARAAAEAAADSARYPDTECRELRAALSGRLGVPGEEIVFGNGAAELIFALAFALRPKRALLCAPGFAEYEAGLRAVGTQIAYYDLPKEDGFRVGKDLLDRIDASCEILFLCNPNNPTGVLIDPALLEQIAARCEETGTRLVLDECFIPLTEDPGARTLTGKLDRYPHLVILRAFTKIYAMAGLRLGYLVTADADLRSRLACVLQPWNVSVPAQAAGTAALRESGYEDKTRKLVAEQRAFLLDGLRRLGFEPVEGQANYLTFFGPEGLYDRCAAEGVLIRDCSNYRGLSEGWYRIAVRTQAENREMLAVLERLLSQDRENM